MKTTHGNHQQHPLLKVVASISNEFDKATTFNPTFVPAGDKAVAMRELSTVITRAQGCGLSQKCTQLPERAPDCQPTASVTDRRAKLLANRACQLTRMPCSPA